DERGSLISFESNKNIPFEIKRVYYIYATREKISRGFHAHKKLKQVVVAVHGSCDFCVDNGLVRNTYHLNSPSQALLIDSLCWREMHNFSEDCVLMVLASDYYDPDDYIHDYNSFLRYLNA
ncbi:WxcM-like domain-containing protein, partial [Escherichia coli]